MNRQHQKRLQQEKIQAEGRAEKALEMLNEALNRRDEAREEARILQEEKRVLQIEFEQAKEQFQQQQRRIMQPQFWTDEVIAPLAREFEMFDLITRNISEQNDGAAHNNDGAAHNTAHKALAELAANFDVERAGHIRKSLVAQWVYLRWLELTNEIAGEDDGVGAV